MNLWIEDYFQQQKIIAFTITNHYQIEHKEVIDNELIAKLVKKLNGRRLRVSKLINNRKVYKWETVCHNKPHRLIFWFKDNTTNHLWIRNCYPID